MRYRYLIYSVTYISSGQLPSDCTKANVSPIFKKVILVTQLITDDFFNCGLCKLQEQNTSLHQNKLLIDQNTILYELQYGFRESETQLIETCRRTNKKSSHG